MMYLKQNATDDPIERTLQLNTELTQAVEDGIERFVILEQIVNFTKIVQDYRNKFKSFSSLGTALDSVKSGVSGLAETVKQHEKLRELGKRLEAVAEVFENATRSPTSRALTVGLPNGVVDLKTLFEKDLKGDWLRRQISDGKDVGKLEKALGPLRKYMTSLEQLTASWQSVREPQTIRLIQQLAEDFTKAADEGRLSEGGDVTRQLEDLGSCFKQKLFDANITDQQIVDVEKFYNPSVTFYQIARLAQHAFVETKKMVIPQYELYRSMQTIKEALKKADSDMPDVEIESCCAKYMGLPKKDWVLNHIEEVYNLFSPMSEINEAGYAVFEAGKFRPILKSLQNSLVNTNLNTTLDCLTEIIYDPTKIQKTLQFGSVMQSIKNRTTEIGAVEAFLKSASVVKGHLKKVVGVVGGATKQSRMRRDENSDAKELLKLDDARKVSLTVGKAVEALRRMEEVRENRVTVTKIARSESTVDAEIAKTSVDFWTPENKERLLGLVKKVEALETEAAKYKGKGFVEMGDVFDSAALIEGVSIDSKLLEDPVSTTLRASNDPQIQAYADDFQNVARLQLDYSKHQVDLQAAPPSLRQLRDFFDVYFGIKRDAAGGGTSSEATSASSLRLIIIIVAVFLITAALIGSAFGTWYCLQKEDPFFWKRMYTKKERIDELISLHSRYLAFFEDEYMRRHKLDTDLIGAVSTGNEKLAEKLVKAGFWIDAEMNSHTCLHVAATKGNAELAEFLIRNGANRSILNENYLTPSGELDSRIEKLKKGASGDEKSKELLENMIKVREVFDSLKDEQFQRRVPHLLATSRFVVFISERCDRSKFEKKYSSMMTQDLTLATHVVVSTDKDGVHDLDDNHVQNISRLFSRAMVVREAWLEASLETKSALRDDYKYQVKKVRFRDTVYDTLPAWHRSFHMKEVPYLQNVQIVELGGVGEGNFYETMERLGAKSHSALLNLEEFNHKSAHPYHIFTHELLWAIFPTVEQKATYLEVADYRRMTTDELLILLLKRELVYDREKKPRRPVRHQQGEPVDKKTGKDLYTETVNAKEKFRNENEARKSAENDKKAGGGDSRRVPLD